VKHDTVRFAPGDVVIHADIGYRGVIIEVDPRFCGPDHLLNDLTGGRAPKDSPWYYVLRDGTDSTVYVAERYLRMDSSGTPINHPMIESVFLTFENGRYIRLNH